MESIICNTQDEARKLVTEAKKEAEDLVSQAKVEAEDSNRHMMELQQKILRAITCVGLDIVKPENPD